MVRHDDDVHARQAAEQLALAVTLDVTRQQQASAAGADEQHARAIVVADLRSTGLQPLKLDPIPRPT